MTSPLYLGLDMGTSGARGIVIDQHGTLIASSQSNLHDHGSNPRDPAGWWAAVSAVLRQLRQTVDMSAVAALCVDATSGTVLAIDADGVPLADALMYNDTVNDQTVLNSIAAHAPATSAVHGASSALARALTLQQSHSPCRVIHQADWINGQLSGDYHSSDESNALKTGYDPVARVWPDWLENTGIALSILPTVIAAGAVAGSVSADVVAEYGFSPATKLVAGMTDGCASFLATGATEVGDCVTALGSTMTMKMLCDRPLFNPEYGIYSHRIGNRWLAGGASNTGGQVLAHFFSVDALNSLSEKIDPETDSGLAYYPLVKPGERFPHNNADWPPVVSPRPADDSEFLKALLEGMATIEQTGYQRLNELGAPAIRSLRTVGGGAANPVWTRIRERKLGQTSENALSTEAAMGVARFALESLG
ncbi:MAG: FGGY-family carbohydrate kinase [Gammaproteobacteria bacterium]|nr:FGGY-family carbohydrate kinase [Gammaproteobacteria bacterium]